MRKESDSAEHERKLEIKPMRAEDLPMVARTHLLSFSGSLMSRLGTGAVERYYLWQMEGPHEHYPIVAFYDNALVGFCVGGISRGALTGFLKKNRIYLFYKVLTTPSLVFNRRYFGKLRTAMSLSFKVLLPKKKTAAMKLKSQASSFGILSICVLPEVQGLGVSQMLMKESERQALEKGFEKMHLTVASENVRAIRFYEKLGFKRIENASSEENTFMEKILK